MKIIIKTQPPPPTYQRGKLKQREQLFYLSDGWRLMAESLEEAEREAELMGCEIDGVEVEH